jgi:hypothetical protein
MGLNDDFTPHGATKPTSIEQAEYQDDILAKRTCEIPNSLQVRYDYASRVDGQPVYIGYGARSLAAASDGWIVHKFTYDVSNQLTLRQTAFSAWDDRTTATYA